MLNKCKLQHIIDSQFHINSKASHQIIRITHTIGATNLLFAKETRKSLLLNYLGLTDFAKNL